MIRLRYRLVKDQREMDSTRGLVGRIVKQIRYLYSRGRVYEDPSGFGYRISMDKPRTLKEYFLGSSDFLSGISS